MISWQAFNPYPPANFSRPQLAPALKFTPAFNACGEGRIIPAKKEFMIDF
jgi:hypothetical protein